MKTKALALLLAASAAILSMTPRASAEVSFEFFYDSLSPYGSWINVADYGECWTPTGVNADWSPYTDGYWSYTDAGWTWVSYEDFGGIVYHYGRWIQAADVGWCWVPDTEWGPAWVSWRNSDDYVGWAPLPPEAQFNVSVGFSTWTDDYYGIGPGYYNFCPIVSFGAPLIRTVCVPRYQCAGYYGSTWNCTNIGYNSYSSVVFCGGPNFGYIQQRCYQPVPTLVLVRNTNITNITNVYNGRGYGSVPRGNTLQVYAPKVVRKNVVKKPNITKIVSKGNVNRGWDVVKDEGDRKRLREKVREEAKGMNVNNAPARPIQADELAVIPKKADPDAPSPALAKSMRNKDIDGDGIPNRKDKDRDGDGIVNRKDTDRNGDGAPDRKGNKLSVNSNPNRVAREKTNGPDDLAAKQLRKEAKRQDENGVAQDGGGFRSPGKAETMDDPDKAARKQAKADPDAQDKAARQAAKQQQLDRADDSDKSARRQAQAQAEAQDKAARRAARVQQGERDAQIAAQEKASRQAERLQSAERMQREMQAQRSQRRALNQQQDADAMRQRQRGSQDQNTQRQQQAELQQRQADYQQRVYQSQRQQQLQRQQQQLQQPRQRQQFQQPQSQPQRQQQQPRFQQSQPQPQQIVPNRGGGGGGGRAAVEEVEAEVEVRGRAEKAGATTAEGARRRADVKINNATNLRTPAWLPRPREFSFRCS